jgi:hypothetical protein
MKFSSLSSINQKFKLNFLIPFSMHPQRPISSQAGKDLGGANNHTTANIESTDSLIVVENENEHISTDPTNESKTVSYKDLCKVENLELGLNRTKSGVSAGLDGEVKAKFTNSKLEKLAEDLKSHNFKPS